MNNATTGAIAATEDGGGEENEREREHLDRARGVREQPGAS